MIWQNPLPTGAAINSIFFINVNTVVKEVRVILDEIREPGIYDIALNADGLASGVYFYQMRTGKYSAVKKLNVAK